MDEIIRLSELPTGCSAVVEEVNCAEYLRNRVLDMGIIRGAELRAVLLSPFGDPVAYAVKNTMIALRKRDSSAIFVRWRHE
ncbi:MAG: ferrous iron transport protein A [Ruminococcus sp.]|nr:ferrous iron transport protein A [Ruminococcus sp.]MBQ4260937.1 ferrous iron transport protein A [Ruminococcus sp.]